MRPHALYRFFGSGGTLLYIGLTADLPARLGKHQEEKPWWTGIANVTIEHYPDRFSVTEAERRAIINEKPLYNVQHNGAQQPKQNLGPPQRRRQSDVIEPQCEGCGNPVPGSIKAVIHILAREYVDAERQIRQWEEDHKPEPGRLQVLRGDDLMSYPKSVRWHIHCDSCNPHDNGDGTLCGGCYWFSLDRCRTHGELLRWTAHLLGKDWFRFTDWDQLIYRLTAKVAEP